MKIVYCAYGGAKYAAQLKQSVLSVRRFHPEARIVVYTVPEFLPHLAGLDVAHSVLSGTDPKPGDWHDPFMKVRAVDDAAQKGEAFLYLDNDTFIAGDLSAAWGLLEAYDCLGVMSPIPDQRGFLGLPHAVGPERPSPEVFPEWNGGVLFFAATDHATRIASRWLEVLEMGIPGGGDQWPLAQALWDSKARLHTLPPTYNCRLPAMPVIYGKACILHADHPDLGAVAAQVNACSGLRQIVPVSEGFAVRRTGSDGARMF